MTGTVTATFEGLTRGTVEFTTNTADGVLRDPTGNVLWAGPKKVRIVGGAISVDLPATDDTAYAETGWQWRAKVKLDGRNGASFLRWFELPDASTVDLAAIAGELQPGDPLTHPLAYADVVADIQDPESVIGQALSASNALPSNGDRSRQGRDVGLKAWTAALADTATVTRVLIEGHSVVTGSGASAPAASFARLVEDGILDVDPDAVVTIDGHAGLTTAEIQALGVPGVITANDHHLVVLMCLLNDYLDQVNPATTTAELQAIVDDYTAGQTPAALSFLIVAEWTRADVASPTYTWAQYVAAAQSVADTNADVTVLDLSQRMGPVATDTLGLYDDDAHPSDIGHRRVADLVLSELMATTPRPSNFPEHVFIPSPVPALAEVGTWGSYSADGSYPFGIRYSAAQNDEITFSFVGEAGTYSILLAQQLRTDGGQVDVYLDGVLQGSGNTWDTYSAAPGFLQGTAVPGFQVTTSGRHTIRLKMATKHASSSGYVLGFCALGITRTGD